MKKKALLINPPTGKYMRDDRCQAPVESMTAQPPRAPMDLAYMAAILEAAGVECVIKDYPFEHGNWEIFKADLMDFNPDYLIISTTTPTLDYDLAACVPAKAHNPAVVTVAKGAHIVENAEKVLADYPLLDIAVWGEYEPIVAELVQLPPAQIRGISCRLGNSILRSQPRAELIDPDRLPLPARHLIRNDLYRTPDTNRPIAYILTGRGCPHHCIYCAVSVASGYKLYMRSVNSILPELEECYYKFGIRDFFFRSDTFTWDEDWVTSLCRAIVNRGLKIRWGTNSRVDTISEKRVIWMKKAGCYVIGFGIESGSQLMLDKMKKRITLEQSRLAVGLCRRYKIKSYLLFIFGLPWETAQSAEETIRFARELDGDFADFNIAYPLPGTEFHAIAKRDKLFEGSLTGYDYGNPLTKSYTLTREELKSIRRRAIMKFYLRPRYIFKTIFGIRNPKILCAYLRQGLAMAAKLLRIRK